MALDPHGRQPVATSGRPLGQSSTALILVHGRGASPASIMELAPLIGHPELTCLAPAAAGNTWYPNSFMADIEANEPGLSSALSVLETLVGKLVDSAVPQSRIVLAGFSQGACLLTEFAVRNPGRYGGVIAFSGGLVGPPDTKWDESGDFEGTPVFLGCSDVDAHVPRERVDKTARVFRTMGALVDKRIYPGMGHTINEDELTRARAIVQGVAAPAS